jgi:NAD(P)-dependent dehydrogenase (short-subunit alcohol dehydrogenase family)
MYDDLFSCRNKTAVVAGGCGFIGREIAMGLAQFGADVYVADRDEALAEKLVQRNIKFIKLDITSEESVRSVLRQVGAVDILVNCTYPRTEDWASKLEVVNLDSWKRNVDYHLGGFFSMSREAAMIMKNHGGGSIVNLASIYGVVAPDFSIYEGTDMTMPVAYASIKAGIIALTKYLATYFGGYGIRANSISPGGMYDNQPASFVANYSRKTPLGRMGNPSEIVGAAVYLASGASSYVTGQNLIVDGGWTTW